MEKQRTALAIALFFVVVGGQCVYQSTRGRTLAEAKAAEAEAAAAKQRVAESRAGVSRPVPGVGTQDAVESSASRPRDVRPEVAASDVRTFELKNPRLHLQFADVGAALIKAELLDHRRVAGRDEPLNLVHHYAKAAKSFDLRNLDDPYAYLPEQPWRVRKDGEHALVFTLEPGLGTFQRPYRVEKRVALHPEAPVVEASFSFEYLGDDRTTAGAFLEQNWRFTPAGGLTLDGEAYGTEDTQAVQSVFFRVDGEGKEEYVAFPLAKLSGVEERNQEKMRAERRFLSGTRRFTADLNTYFGVFCALTEMPDATASFTGVEDPDAVGGRVGRVLRTRTDLEFKVRPRKGAAPVRHGVAVYFGPSDESALSAAAPAATFPFAADFTRAYGETLGFWGWIGRAVLALLDFLHGITGSWGWAVVLMTVCVRLLLFPINRRSQMAMRTYSEGMQRIKPEADKLKEKFKDKPMEFAAAQRELMRREKVSMVPPVGGCLPIFLQIPVFYGLFSGLRASIDLRQAPFLWVRDLSQPDHLITFSSPITNPMKWFESCTCCVPPGMSDTISGLHLLPLLMTAAWIVNQMLMPRPLNETPEMAQQRKLMLAMPFVFGFTMYGYAAALSLYWLTSSLCGIVESKVIRRMIDRAAAAKAAAKALAK